MKFLKKFLGASSTRNQHLSALAGKQTIIQKYLFHELFIGLFSNLLSYNLENDYDD